MTCDTCGWYPLVADPFPIGGVCDGCKELEQDCYCEDAEGGDD